MKAIGPRLQDLFASCSERAKGLLPSKQQPVSIQSTAQPHRAHLRWQSLLHGVLPATVCCRGTAALRCAGSHSAGRWPGGWVSIGWGGGHRGGGRRQRRQRRQKVGGDTFRPSPAAVTPLPGAAGLARSGLRARQLQQRGLLTAPHHICAEGARRRRRCRRRLPPWCCCCRRAALAPSPRTRWAPLPCRRCSASRAADDIRVLYTSIAAIAAPRRNGAACLPQQVWTQPQINEDWRTAIQGRGWTGGKICQLSFFFLVFSTKPSSCPNHHFRCRRLLTRPLLLYTMAPATCRCLTLAVTLLAASGAIIFCAGVGALHTSCNGGGVPGLGWLCQSAGAASV